jgi:D-xylose transport system substrate-binding protein
MPISTFTKRLMVLVGSLVLVAAVVAGCGGSSGGGGTKIALLLPENETPRYETNDRPDFEKAIEKECGECEPVLYSNAGGDAEKQQSQAEAALTQGAEVLVVDAEDSKSAAAIVEKAKAQGVPVVAYDRLIENSDVAAYVSFNNEKVGELQAETLAGKLKEDGAASGPIIMINGDPADPNAALFKAGAHKGFEAAGVKVAKEYDTPGWSAEAAQREAQQAITALGSNGFAAIYAANDETGGGAIAAMKGAGIKPEEKPVTGQDSTVAGLQRILTGEQFMTIYKEIEPEAQISAEIALALAEGKEVPKEKITEEVNNGKVEVPSVLLKPIAVTKENVKSTVVAGGFVTAAELCTSAYQTACKEAGISG